MGLEAGLNVSSSNLEESIRSFFLEKEIHIDIGSSEVHISAKSKDPSNSVTSEYSEMVRFDDVTPDHWGSSVVVDRIRVAVRRCKYFTEPNVYSGDVSNNVLAAASPYVNDAIEDAEDHIVVSDIAQIFKSILNEEFVHIDVESEEVKFLMKINGISRIPDQDSLLVCKYAIS